MDPVHGWYIIGRITRLNKFDNSTIEFLHQ